MAGKVYLTEDEYRTVTLRDNETRKAFSASFFQLATVLIGAGAAQAYSDGHIKPEVGLWFLIAMALIILGVAFLRSLEAER